MTVWQDTAACRGMDANLFVFQEPRGHTADAKVIAAKAVCAGCPVVADCLDDALSFDAVGVWGGLSEDERRVLQGHPPRVGHRPRTDAVCGTYAGYRHHMRHGDPVDDACREARRIYHAEYRALQATA